MIIVTGGAGFIGSNLVAALEERGERDIVVCDRPLNDAHRRNLAKRRAVTLIDPDDLAGHLHRHGREIRAIFHLGAISATTATDVDLILRTNFVLSMTLWDWCVHNQTRLIYASSAATYGDGTEGFDDDFSLAALSRLRPLNLYGWSKHLFDCHVAQMLATGARPPAQWAGLKFFNVYGPNEAHKGGQKSVVAQIYPPIAAGEPALLFRSHHPDYEDGGQLRDFVWVGDCVQVMLWLLDTPAVNGLFNLGTGQARSFADLAGAVFSALGQNTRIEFRDTPEDIRDKYQYFTEARMSRLRAAGYTAPFTPLEDGVGRYVRDHLAAADPYR